MYDLNIFELLILNCIAIIGFWQACFPEMILGRYLIYKWWSKPYFKVERKGAIIKFDFRFPGCNHWNISRLPDWVKKPLYECAPCMASLWSFPYLFTDFELWYYPIYILALAGLNAIITTIVRFE